MSQTTVHLKRVVRGGCNTTAVHMDCSSYTCMSFTPSHSLGTRLYTHAGTIYCGHKKVTSLNLFFPVYNIHDGQRPLGKGILGGLLLFNRGREGGGDTFSPAKMFAYLAPPGSSLLMY